MTGEYSEGLDSLKVDFYVIKGILEELLEYLGYKNRYTLEANAGIEELHPGQSASIIVSGVNVGIIGKLHPSITKEDIYVMEINLAKLFLFKVKHMQYKEISKYPAITKDMAFVIKKNIEAKEVMSVIKKACGKLLTDINIFDVYEGENVLPDERSIAFSLTFQEQNRTLSDEEVMNLFIILGNNKNYLNEMFFLKKLKKLNIAKVSDLGPGVGGTYTDSEVKVRLVDKYNITIYHELTHFIDFSINNKNNIYYLFDCNGEYVIKKEFTNACSLVNIDTNFITEAGAELYSGKYLTNELEAYNPAPSILSAMEYILGTEEINKWYFENDAYFKKLWLDIGYSIDETKKIIKYMTNTTQINSNASDNIIYIIDTLIDLYKNKKDENFMNDKAFVYILRNLIDYQTDFKASRYKSELNSIISKENNILKQVNETIKDYYLYESYGDFLIENNKYYILIFCSKENTSGYLAINYDFENDKIIDYTFTPRRVLEWHNKNKD